ncbi:MAG: hypothetical protein ACLUI3_06010 [Christensenellales bacterium]
MSSGLAVEMLRHGSPASYALFDAHNIREDFLAKPAGSRIIRTSWSTARISRRSPRSWASTRRC